MRIADLLALELEAVLDIQIASQHNLSAAPDEFHDFEELFEMEVWSERADVLVRPHLILMYY